MWVAWCVTDGMAGNGSQGPPNCPGAGSREPNWPPKVFAFDVLFGTKGEDKFPRRIGADAWFDRWDAERYEAYEQTIRTSDDEVLTLVRIDDDAMLG